MIHFVRLFWKHELVNASFRGVALRGMAVFGGLISSVVLANILGPEKFGTYAFAFAIITMIALPVEMGLPTLVVRETARADLQQDWALLHGILSWANRVIFTTSAVVIGVAVLALALLGHMVSEVRQDALLWGLPLVPLLAYGHVRAAALRGLKRVFQAGFPEQVLRPLLLAGFVGFAALLFGKEKLQASFALGLNSLAAFLCFLLGAWFLRRAYSARMRSEKEKRIEGAEWRKAIIPLSLIAGLQVVTYNTGLLLLGIMASDYEVGQYRVAITIMTLGSFGLMTLYMVAQPYLVSAYYRGDTEQLQRTASDIAMMALLVSLGVALVIWLFGEPIIQLLYGSEFWGAYQPLCVLMGGAVVHAAFGMGGGILTMTGNERLVLVMASFGAMLNVVGNLVLIPYYGIMGTAVATAVSLSVAEIGKYLIAKKRVNVDGSALSWIVRLRRVRTQ